MEKSTADAGKNRQWLYYDDLHVGYKTSAREHTVSEQEIVSFAEQWDPMPFHVDAGRARNSIFGGLTASGAHLYAIFVKLAHKQERKLALIAALGVDQMKFIKPVRPGDTLHLKGECLSLRPSSSKSDRGVCWFAFEIVNQHGQTVLQLKQPLLMARRATGAAVVPGLLV